MGKFVDYDYAFDASAKTVVFTNWSSGLLKKEQLFLITNVVDGIIIYNFADPTKGGTITPDVGGDILTLEYDTTLMDDADELQIIMDDLQQDSAMLFQIQNNTGGIYASLPSALGQTTKAGSLSVALASDQDALPITDNAGSLTVDNPVLSVVGGGTEATAQRVTIASDSTGVLSVDDNGSTLSIDDGGGNISIDDGGNSITVDFTQPALVAGSAIIGKVGIDQTTPGTTNAVQANAGTNLNTSALALESGGNLDAIKTSVQLIDDAIKTDDAGFTPATDKVMMVGAQLDNTSPDSVDEGDAGALRMSANRNLFVNIRDAAGNERGLNIDANGEVQISGTRNALAVTDNSGSLTVDAPVGTPVFTRLSDGSAALVGQKAMTASLPVVFASDQSALTVSSHAVTNAGTFLVQDSQKVADNGGFTDGTTPVNPAGYIYDEVAGTALTENDVAAARINVNRAQINVIEDGSTRGRYATVSAANALKVDASGVAVPVTDNSGSLTVDAPVGTPIFSTLTPGTTGGWDTFMATSADGSTALTSTAQAIKASAGNFGGYYIYNPNSSAVYVHIYNVASGSVTVGTTNPKNTFCIPATSGANLEITNGIKYDTAMSCSATTTGGGNTAPSTALEANFFYK